MKYLRATIAVPLTLQADNMHMLKWWVDASFTMNPDMKVTQGGALAFRRGAV